MICGMNASTRRTSRGLPMYATKEEVLDTLRTAVRSAGTQQKFADAKRLSRTYVADVLLGRREPSEAILSALGYRRRVVYEKAAPESGGEA